MREPGEGMPIAGMVIECPTEAIEGQSLQDGRDLGDVVVVVADGKIVPSRLGKGDQHQQHQPGANSQLLPSGTTGSTKRGAADLDPTCELLDLRTLPPKMKPCKQFRHCNTGDRGASTNCRQRVTVHEGGRDWSIFRRINVTFTLDVVRKHGPVPFFPAP